MTDFKVGDRVKVVSNIDPDNFDSYVGDTGTVVKIGQVDVTYGEVWKVESDTDSKVRSFYEGELGKMVD